MEAVPAAEPVLDPAKKQWAVSAAILGGIYVVVSLSGLIFNLKNGSIPSSFAVQAYSLSAFSMLISMGFLIGGILSLRGSNVGITILTYTPVAAIACLIIQVYFQYTFLHSDAYAALLAAKYQQAGMTQDQYQPVMSKVIDFALGATVGISIIEAVYCIVLYIKMSAEPPAVVMEG